MGRQELQPLQGGGARHVEGAGGGGPGDLLLLDECDHGVGDLEAEGYGQGRHQGARQVQGRGGGRLLLLVVVRLGPTKKGIRECGR